jgi:hypothetical protein
MLSCQPVFELNSGSSILLVAIPESLPKLALKVVGYFLFNYARSIQSRRTGGETYG